MDDAAVGGLWIPITLAPRAEIFSRAKTSITNHLPRNIQDVPIK